ncbi:amidase [Lentibacillus sp. CBA3610]|uniref:amidase n=1 Tax=Lentibacillus sp. CBA3610 TaxID=2518176 RepID=UPI001595A116|nr:amidase [Lentibacillus sp. CBA3610]QKY70085.1 amidase [Lentibacillus sp. CBA3610]
MPIDTEKRASSILDMDATSLAETIQHNDRTSTEIVESYINHQRQVNPAINAVVENRYESAMDEVRQKDEQHSQANHAPLYGVPISVKESFHVAGMKTTGGLVHRKHLIAKEDAEAVRRLKRAGAIILNKTNTPMLCFCQETDNKLYGRTNNPWDLTRTSGGSSGGEGALLGAGGAAAGIGSDIGGSIRLPSHFNGVIGFKPGPSQVSDQGHFPGFDHPLQKRMSGIGPMGKSVRDIALLYRLMADERPVEQTITDFTIDILPDWTGFPMSAATKHALNQVEGVLKQDMTVRRSVPPYFGKSAQLWQEIMSIDGGKAVAELAYNGEPNVVLSYLKEKLSQRTSIHSYLSWALIGAKLFKPSTHRLKEIEATIKQGDDVLASYLQDRLLIFPVYHMGAPEHGKVYQEIFSIRKTFLQYMPYVAYANVWGLPSLTVPVAENENGLPIGVQVMSINGNENAIFDAGKLLEDRLRGYVRSATV